MSSWHEKTCRKADVHVIDGLPFCMRCASNASIEDATAAAAGPNILLPEPRPRWQMNLRWPRSVSYTRTTGSDAIADEIAALLQRGDETGELAATQSDGQINNTHVDNLIAHIAPSEASDVTMSSFEDIAAPSDSTSTWQAVSISNLSLYDTLDEDDHIRLFTLRKGKAADPLHGMLSVASLKTRPQFEAISYTWADERGDISKRKKVFVGERWDVHLITANCQAALARFRLPDEDRVLWVDQICIDQGREYERTHHVGLIRDIYATASSVLVYLGEDDAARSGALAMDSISRAHDGRGIDRTSQTALHDLFARPYFQRVWVIQELAMARAALVHCGRGKLGWSLFNEDRLRLLGLLDTIPAWILEFRSPRYRGTDELVPLLESTITSKAADPRDKIFSLLGLVQDAFLDGIVPDYSLSVPEVMIGTASFVMLHQGRHDILKYACGLNGAAKGLPSWVPDWSDIATLALDENIRQAYNRELATRFEKYFEARAFHALDNHGMRFHLESERELFNSRYRLTQLPRPHFEGQQGGASVNNMTGALSICGVDLGRLDTVKPLDSSPESLIQCGIFYDDHVADFKVMVAYQHIIDKENDYLFLLEGEDTCFHMRKQPVEGTFVIMGVCRIAVAERVRDSTFFAATTPHAISDLPLTLAQWHSLVDLEKGLKEIYSDMELIDDAADSLLRSWIPDKDKKSLQIVLEAVHIAFLENPDGPPPVIGKSEEEKTMVVDGEDSILTRDSQSLATAIMNRLKFWHRDASWTLVRKARHIKGALTECDKIKTKLDALIEPVTVIKKRKMDSNNPEVQAQTLKSTTDSAAADDTAPHVYAKRLQSAIKEALKRATYHELHHCLFIEIQGEKLHMTEQIVDRVFQEWIQALTTRWEAKEPMRGDWYSTPRFDWGPFAEFVEDGTSVQGQIYTRRMLMQLRPETRQESWITII